MRTEGSPDLSFASHCGFTAHRLQTVKAQGRRYVGKVEERAKMLKRWKEAWKHYEGQDQDINYY